MDLLSNLALGFQVAMTWQNLLYAFGGAILGILVGVLPGLGPVAAIALLLPCVHRLDATSAIILLAGLYGGAQYSGAITAVYGDQMTRCRAGAILALTDLGSFFAACIGTAVIAVMATPLTELAFKFGPPEYFSLMVLGLIGSVVLASGSLIKSISMILLGLLLGQVNLDRFTGAPRLSLGVPALSDGIGFVVIAIGIFGLGQLIAKLGQPEQVSDALTLDKEGSLPTPQDIQETWPAILRGTTLGAILGLLPGGGALLASFAARTMEMKTMRGRGMPRRDGALQGVVGSASAGNAAARTSFLPTMTLGIPPNAGMALLVGALTIKGIPPGPQVMTSNPDLFWGLIASMWIGSLMLVAVRFPLIGIWSKLLTAPYRCLFPGIVAMCCIGCYTLNGDSFDVYAAALFALIGYILHKLSCDPAPLLLGFILGPMIEENMRRALFLSHGDWATFINSPLSAALLIGAGLMLVTLMLPSIRNMREVAFKES